MFLSVTQLGNWLNKLRQKHNQKYILHHDPTRHTHIHKETFTMCNKYFVFYYIMYYIIVYLLYFNLLLLFLDIYSIGFIDFMTQFWATPCSFKNRILMKKHIIFLYIKQFHESRKTETIKILPYFSYEKKCVYTGPWSEYSLRNIKINNSQFMNSWSLKRSLGRLALTFGSYVLALNKFIWSWKKIALSNSLLSANYSTK